MPAVTPGLDILVRLQDPSGVRYNHPMNDAERRVLQDLLAYSEEIRAYPDLRVFRVRHERDRTTIDDLVDEGLVRSANYAGGPRYAPTLLGLNALGDERARAILDDALVMLGWLQEHYRTNPMQDVETLKAVSLVGADTWRVERALRVLETLPGWRASSPTHDGRLNLITLAESVLDITASALQQRPLLAEGESQTDELRQRPLLRALKMTNFLSFGDECVVPLGALNVLVGANGSGKSNFLAAVSLLRYAPTDSIPRELNRGGGAASWLWANAKTSRVRPYVSPGYAADMIIEAEVASSRDGSALRYRMGLTSLDHDPVLVERICAVASDGAERLVFGHEGGSLILDARGVRRHVAQRELRRNRTILFQRRDPEQFPELSALADAFSRIRLYREWDFGPNGSFRYGGQADLQTDALAENMDNGILVLNQLARDAERKSRVLYYLQRLADGFNDYETVVEGGSVHLYVKEGMHSIPASRLSDGTLRYLMLLAALLNPNPPPVICIEEPELGLHPEILPTIVELLEEASARTQIIVTTHSDILLDALNDPAALLIFDKVDGATRVTRGDEEVSAERLASAGLGRRWLEGELGGTRW